jgi:metallo-beta-lactamase class B
VIHLRRQDGANTHRAITVGGLGLNAIESSKQVEEFIASLDKIAQLVKQPNYPITVHLTTHPFSNGLTEIREKAISRKPGEQNPLVDPRELPEQIAYLRWGAGERLEIERKVGR